MTSGEKTKTTGYQYDKVGNRLYQTVADGTKTVSTKYTYNALGQLTKTQKGLGQAQNVANWYNEEIYTYDNYGNRTGTEVYEVNEGITGSEKSGDVRYSYDESNQMVKYETKGTEEESWTEKARNVYNGEGMRVRQYEDGNSWARQYFYIGGALSISTDGSNENFVKSENILTPDGTILAALREAKAGEEIEGNAYWIYHYDARGSATNLVGAKNGSLYRAEENIYDAFGNEEKEIKQSTSSVVNDIKFTGATLDNSGTYYLGSRHYDPNTGRFLQQDTFKGEVIQPVDAEPVHLHLEQPGELCRSDGAYLWCYYRDNRGRGSGIFRFACKRRKCLEWCKSGSNFRSYTRRWNRYDCKWIVDRRGNDIFWNRICCRRVWGYNVSGQ